MLFIRDDIKACFPSIYEMQIGWSVAAGMHLYDRPRYLMVGEITNVFNYGA